MYNLQAILKPKHFFVLSTLCFFVHSVIAQIPTISLVTPASGAAGSTVTITGTNFSTTAATNTVYFGAVKATVSAASATSLTVKVPAGATYQPVTVTTNSLTAYSSQSFIVTFPGSNTLGPSSFDPRTFFETGSWPESEAAGDLDGDGRADIVTMSAFDYSMTILHNSSTTNTINFDPKIVFSNGNWRINSTISLCDVDGDGNLDIALGSSGEATIYFYRNTSIPGSISFAAPVQLSTGSGPGMDFADFDGDGKPDAVVISNAFVSIFKNTSTPGNISFASKVDFEGANNQGYQYITAADFNGDGKPDFAFADYVLNKVFVYKNTGGSNVIKFDAKASFTTGANPQYIAAADFTGDGKLDMVVTNYGSNSISLLKNNGTAVGISFDIKTDIDLSAVPISLAVGNINGDARPDIIIGKQGFQQLSVLQNNTPGGSLSFLPAIDYSVGQQANSVIACDLDNDGKADLASTNKNSFSISALRNRLSEPLIASFTPAGGPAGTSISIKGSGFTDASTVIAGGVAVSSFTVVSDSNIIAVVGNGYSGSISVTTPFGSSSMPGFTFGMLPVITSFSPVLAKQGDQVLIKGTGLSGTTALSFGGVPAQFYYGNTDTSIYGRVATGASGSIAITTATGAASLPGFTFLPPPSVISLTPASALSGNTITIIGKNFTGVSAVSFGSIPAISFTLLSDSVIKAVVGNGASGSVSVSATGGTGFGGNFTYLGPDVSSFSPQKGGQGTVVSINGTNFTGVTAVKFGGITAASFTVNSPSSITAVTGTGATGDVTVTTAAGTGTKGSFTAPPYITSFAPLSGQVGTSVIIRGNSFASYTYGNIVYFGGIRAVVETATDTSLSVTVPAGSSYLPISVTVNYLTGYSLLPFTTTFAGGAFIPAAFAHWQDLTPYVSPLNLAMGDLNNDGKPELVSAGADGSLAIFKNNSTPDNLLFADGVKYPLSSGLYNATGVAVADFTGDGMPDVAIINYGENLLSVFRNESYSNNISIGSRVNFGTGANPSAISTGDVNGDGATDIIVTNYNSQTVSVYINTTVYGFLSFAARVDYPTGVNPAAVNLADLNHDGRLDMVVVNEGENTVSIFKNTSAGGVLSFATKVDYATGGGPRSVATGDLDADGDIDIVVGNSGSFFASVFKNTSNNDNISFNTQVSIATESGPSTVSVNDMDGDGKPDIWASSFSTASIGLLKNISTPGNIGFAAGVSYPVVGYPGKHITGDLDGDGKTDIATVAGGIAVLRNNMNDAPVINSFSPSNAYPGDTITILGNHFTGTTAASFGGNAFDTFTIVSDKIMRAIPSLGSSGNIAVTTPYGTATLAGFSYTLPPAITGFSPRSGPVGSVVTISGNNFNSLPAGNSVFFGTAKALVTAATATSLMVSVPPGANDQRISVANKGRIGMSSHAFTVTFPGAGTVFDNTYFDTTKRVVLTLSEGGGFNAGDMDGDGKIDFIVSSIANHLSTSKNITSNGNFAFGPLTNHPQDNANAAGFPFLFDANGDGKPDVALQLSTDVSALSLYKNSSTGGIISLGPESVLKYNISGPFTCNTADLDGDGRIDIIIKSFYSDNIFVYRNISTNDKLSFAPPVVGAGSGSPTLGGRFLAEDFDGDGRPDLALLYNKTLSVFKNTGSIGAIEFSPKINFTFSDYANDAYAADLDGDGKIDILKINSQSNALSVMRNNGSSGNFSFENDAIFPIGYTIGGIVIADMDGDVKQDICIIKSESDTISILKNTGTPGTIAFATKVNYIGNGPGQVMFADVDNDGKPDLITYNNYSRTIAVMRNTIAEPVAVVLCPPQGNKTITSNITGSTYRWQLNTGSGFNDITNNANYSNTTTSTLQLINIPSAWYGYQYRCLAGVVNSHIFSLKFSNNWAGTMSTAWENPANWSCGTAPDANTDVVINTGAVVINSNITVRSLKLSPGASLTVATGFKLTVLQ